MNEQDFKNEFKPIKDILEKQEIFVDADDYDGVVVKMLECNNTRGCGSQTHIEFTGTQMEMFPYLASYAYFNDFRNEGDFKSFYTFKMPIALNIKNLQYLFDNHEIYDRTYIEQNKKNLNNKSLFEEHINYLAEILDSEEYDNESEIECHTTVLRGQKEEGVHAEISQIKSSDKKFEAFRWLLPVNSYLIILKLRKEVKYKIYGILPNDAEEISHLHLKFNYYHTAQGVKTLVSLEDFEVPNDEGDNEILDGNFDADNLLLYGVPGVGKSWTIKNVKCKGVDEDHMERVVFHPDYTYSDFVGQILPKVLDNEDIKYEFVPGPFTYILKKANERPSEKFYLIIEEINRGNAPAIFGDIFQLLDRMKKDDKEHDLRKGDSEFGITNSEVAEEVYGKKNKNLKVRIPSNLRIIATMNTSDQNVFTLDTAFKRRWHMEMIENDFNKPKFKDWTIKNSNITWQVFGEAINEIILENANSTLSSEDKRLGAFFIDEDDFESSKQFAEKVLMYLWDDVFKFDREKYFNKGSVDQFSLEKFIEKFEKTEERESFIIFTSEINEKIKEVKKRLEEEGTNSHEEVQSDLEIEENDSEKEVTYFEIEENDSEE